jgi:hypothetical protein
VAELNGPLKLAGRWLLDDIGKGTAGFPGMLSEVAEAVPAPIPMVASKVAPATVATATERETLRWDARGPFDVEVNVVGPPAGMDVLKRGDAVEMGDLKPDSMCVRNGPVRLSTRVALSSGTADPTGRSSTTVEPAAVPHAGTEPLGGLTATAGRDDREGMQSGLPRRILVSGRRAG